MKNKSWFMILLSTLLLVVAMAPSFAGPVEQDRLRVVTTLPDYAVFAKLVGGERVSVEAICRGDQDAHFIRPKPSFVRTVNLIPTGSDNRAEIKAMCSFPSPLAIDKATSVPLIFPLSFLEI